MTRFDLSVVIATRERWPLLQGTLAQLERQRLDQLRIEVVVADALSNDGSWEGLERHASDPAERPFRLTILQSASWSGAAARNAALAAASGEVVLFLADDARPARDDFVVKHALAHLGAGERGRALSGTLAFEGESERSGLARHLLATDAVGDDRGWASRAGIRPRLRLENGSIPRSVLIEQGGFDERFIGWNLEGAELSLRLHDADVAFAEREDVVALRADVPDRRRWLRELQDVGRHAVLLEQLRPIRSNPGPRGIAAALARAAYPALTETSPAAASRAALARGRGRAALPALRERRGGLRPVARPSSRPAISLVVPFYGEPDALRELVDALRRVRTATGDEIVVADNTPHRISDRLPVQAPIRFVHAHAEQSAPHARNAGASEARNEWLLFIDADCRPSPGLLDACFTPPPADDAGAVAGAILDPIDQRGMAARYAASRERLGQSALLAHPYMPAAVTANLLVRRRTWEELGGFCEGIRSEEDLDFCWRMQRSGWKLQYNPAAAVEHRHRESVRALLAQARRFGRGFAWQDRRYPGSRITGRLLPHLPRLTAVLAWSCLTLRGERAAFAGLDILVATAEVAGRLEGGVAVAPAAAAGNAAVVLVVDTYGDVWSAPIARDARALQAGGATVRIEAMRRGEWLDRGALRRLRVRFLEDDGVLPAIVAVLRLFLRRPAAVLRSRGTRLQCAPAAVRLRSTGAGHLHALGGGRAAFLASRLAALADLPFSVHVDRDDSVSRQEDVLARASFLTTPCDFGAARVRAALAGHPGAPDVHVVSHVVCRVGRTVPGELPVVLAAGRLSEGTGVEHVITATASLSRRGLRVQTRIIGEGPSRKRLQQLAREHGVPDVVEIPGIRQPEDMACELARADLLVVPGEPGASGGANWLPTVALEALAAACPIVAGDVGGMPELVSQGCGRVVAPGNVEQLTEAIESMLRPPADEREAMSAAAAVASERARPADVAARLIELMGVR